MNFSLKNRIWFLFICLFFLPHCAKSTKPPVYKKPVPVSRPAPVNIPENDASLELVLNGKEALDEGLLDKAELSFEEAIRISPQLGDAYYWLAMVKYKMSKMTPALNLLDKAETLLNAHTDWMEKIDELRSLINES